MAHDTTEDPFEAFLANLCAAWNAGDFDAIVGRCQFPLAVSESGAVTVFGDAAKLETSILMMQADLRRDGLQRLHSKEFRVVRKDESYSRVWAMLAMENAKSEVVVNISADIVLSHAPDLTSPIIEMIDLTEVTRAGPDQPVTHALDKWA